MALSLVAGVGILAEPAEGEAPESLDPLLLIARNLPLSSLRFAVQASSAAAGVVCACCRSGRCLHSLKPRAGVGEEP